MKEWRGADVKVYGLTDYYNQSLLPRLARSRYCAFVEAREALRVRGGVTEARQGNQNYESEK